MTSVVLSAALVTIALFLGMLLLLEVGRRAGVRRIARDPEGARAGIGVVEGAVFGLLGLMIAFSFSGAASRFDARRHLIVEETNDIGTAYLRLDLLPASAQPALRDAFRRYLDKRIEAYRVLPDLAAAERALGEAGLMQQEIWRAAVAATRAPDAAPGAPVLLLPALNAMFDITTTRTLATRMHPPLIVFIMLVAIALASALLAGYAMGGGRFRGWLHMVCFAAAISVAVYVIVDLEFPRFGLIRVDSFDRALVDLRRSLR